MLPTALVVGVVLALLCLAYVLYPLLKHERGRGRSSAGPKGVPRVVSDDEIEAAVRTYRARLGPRACPTCGPRPESDAQFCSTCGRRLEGATGP